MTVATTTITVRSTELDAYGHVNNARYVEYFEWGRFDWIAATGLEERMREDQTAYVVVDLHVVYKKEARRGQQLQLHTRLAKLGRSSMTVAQQLQNAEGAVLAEGEVTLVAFDPVARRSRRIPETQHELLSAHLVADSAPTEAE